jgi:hypothetical protein
MPCLYNNGNNNRSKKPSENNGFKTLAKIPFHLLWVPTNRPLPNTHIVWDLNFNGKHDFMTISSEMRSLFKKLAITSSTILSIGRRIQTTNDSKRSETQYSQPQQGNTPWKIADELLNAMKADQWKKELGKNYSVIKENDTITEQSRSKRTPLSV